jgi:thiamine biosynthesis lipoprotein ApbE
MRICEEQLKISWRKSGQRIWPALLAIALIVSQCSAESLFTRVHPAMGTDFTLYVYAADGTAADREAERVFSIVDQLDALLSNYQPQSELSRINNEAASHAVTTDPEIFRFLKESLGWSARSDGAFDITVGKLMKAWGFFRSTGHVPSDAELAKVHAETGWKRVVLDQDTRTVRFTTPGVELGRYRQGLCCGCGGRCIARGRREGGAALCRFEHDLRTGRTTRRAGMEGAGA